MRERMQAEAAERARNEQAAKKEEKALRQLLSSKGEQLSKADEDMCKQHRRQVCQPCSKPRTDARET